VIHDADPWGMNIARTLREETARMPGYKVDVNDIGLRLRDALEMGLAVEEFTRNKAIPQALVLSDLEREYFVGRQVGKNSWISKRVELNAFTAPELVKYIVWGLENCGATGKVIPPKSKLPKLAKGIFNDEAESEIREELEQLLSVEEIWKAVAQELYEEMPLGEAARWIKEGFAEEETLSWDAALKQSMRQQIKDKKERLRELLLAKLREAIASNPELG
jgi:hypothetical protein